MMKSLFLLFSIFLVFAGCASKKDKMEIKKKTQQSNVTDSKSLNESIQEAIRSSNHLSADQKQQLENIISANKQIAQKLTEESYKLRSVLIQELLSDKMNAKKVKLIEKSIARIEKKKLKNTFDAIEKISQVVSHNPDKQIFSDPLMNFERAYR